MEFLKKRNKTYFQPMEWTKIKVPSRGICPICGPPRFSFPLAQKILMGGGSLLLMMIIPFWGVFSLTSWADKHQRLGRSNIVEEEEVPPESAENEEE